MDATLLPPPAPVMGFLLVHAALRRDADALRAASSRGDVVHHQVKLFDRVIRAHHHGEDKVLLPLLRSREPEIRDVADRVEEQHTLLDHALDRLRVAVADRRTRDVATGAAELSTLLEEHLALEENGLLPVWAASLSAADHERFARRLRRATPWRDVAVMVPWLLDAVPGAARPSAEGELPRAVRFAYRYGLRRRFEQRWRPALGTSR